MAVTSEYFRANLGLLDSDAAGMLDPWCQRTYEQHFIGRGPSGEYVLTASCRQPKSRKSILMAIRTAFSNSGHPLSTLRGDGVEFWAGARSIPKNACSRTERQLRGASGAMGKTEG